VCCSNVADVIVAVVVVVAVAASVIVVDVLVKSLSRVCRCHQQQFRRLTS